MEYRSTPDQSHAGNPIYRDDLPQGPRSSAIGHFGLRWTSDDGRDDLNLVADAINGGQWGYNNLHGLCAGHYHKLNDYWHIAFETYNLHENNVPILNRSDSRRDHSRRWHAVQPSNSSYSMLRCFPATGAMVLTCTASTQTFSTYQPSAEETTLLGLMV